MSLRTAPLALSAFLAGTAALAQGAAAPVEQGPPNVPDFRPAFPEQTRAPEAASSLTLEVTTIADGLDHPWGIALLPDGGFLVTERSGTLRLVGADGAISDPVAGLPEVFVSGQGGLLDVTVSPNFAEDRLIFWTYAKPVGDRSATAAARGRLAGDGASVTEVRDIFVQDPPSPTDKHYGSRIVLDGEGHAFVTTGEHSSTAERVFAQDLAKTYGKVVRIDLDGTPPADNPFAGRDDAIPAVWSYGHRNIQSAALDAEGRLWIAEHGPKGGDEVNLVRPGANYGWPVISYGENYSGTPIGEGVTAREGMEQPIYYWDPVIAPSGMAFYEGAMFPDWQGDLLVGAMRPGALVRLELEGDKVVGEERLLTDQGRIRDIAIARDGAILVVTDAADGKLLRLAPAASLSQ
jgi:glucose/arabinose dehydrogenase